MRTRTKQHLIMKDKARIVNQHYACKQFPIIVKCCRKEVGRLAEKIQWHPGFYAGMELELKAFDLSLIRSIS